VLDFQITAAQTALLTTWHPNAYAGRVRANWTGPNKQVTLVTSIPVSAMW